MEDDSNGNYLPDEIIDGGNHSDDFNRKRIPICNEPRERLLQVAREKDLRRPERRN